MYAVVQIPDFSLHALLRLKPELRGEPIGILIGEGRRALVSVTNAPGVETGMTAAQALSECPALQLVAPSLVAECEAGAVLLNACWTLSPRVEASGAGWCTVDLTGARADHLRPQLQQIRERFFSDGLPLRVGIGPNALLARYAAYWADPELWVDDPRGFLAPLPIDLLDLTADEDRLFADLGLKTLGSLTAFPRAALTDRLGSRGDELWARAAGEWKTPLQPAPFPSRHLANVDLEEAVETLEPLLFVIRRFCDRLAAEVGQFGGGTSKLSLTLRLEDEKVLARDFDLPEPTAKPDLLFAVLENHLSSLRTDTAIVGLSLEAFSARRVQQQEGLFDTGLRDAPMFFATLGRLAAVVGSDRVGTPRHLDSHRPEAIALVTPPSFIPERKAPSVPKARGTLFRRLRPPMRATVELTDARPSFLISDLTEGAITVLRRPAWVNGEWWEAHTWAREEWDVQIGHNLFRLLHEPAGWFIDGICD